MKKKASPFRFFYEQFLVQQDFGKFPPEWDKSFLAFIKHKRKILRSLQEKGVDIGYVLSVLLDIAWTIRIPPLGKEKNFWERGKKPIQESIDAMKDFSPRYFKQEIIEGVEKGLEKLAWKSEDSYMYFGVNEHIVIVGSSRRGKGRVKEDRLNNTIARLDYYFKKAKIHYRPQRIAELLNACLLEGYPPHYFDESKIDQRIRRFNHPDPKAFYKNRKLSYQRHYAAFRSYCDAKRRMASVPSKGKNKTAQYPKTG